MYDFLKVILPAAEQLGSITDVHMIENDPVLGNLITVKGTGRKAFELSVTIGEVGCEEESHGD